MFDYVYKITIVGETGVGKSSITTRFVEDKFEKHYDMTIGVDLGSRIIPIQDKKIKLQIWDTAGQEQFRSIIKSYYRNSAGALICFDLTNRRSFEKVTSWLNEIKNNSDHVQIILVGTKLDMKNHIEISEDEISKFCNLYHLQYMEVSSLNNTNIYDVFELLATNIYNHVQKYPYLIRTNMVETGIKQNEQEEQIIKKDNTNKLCCQIL